MLREKVFSYKFSFLGEKQCFSKAGRMRPEFNAKEEL